MPGKGSLLEWEYGKELGKINVCQDAELMIRLLHAPRKGHLDAMERIYTFVKLLMNSTLVFDGENKDLDLLCLEDNKFDWVKQYSYENDKILEDIPEPLGASTQVLFFVNVDHVTNFMTKRSTAIVLISLNGAQMI